MPTLDFHVLTVMCDHASGPRAHAAVGPAAFVSQFRGRDLAECQEAARGAGWRLGSERVLCPTHAAEQARASARVVLPGPGEPESELDEA